MASSATGVRMNHPQAFLSSYAPRLRTYGNALLAPVVPQMQLPAAPRLTKRGTTAINYAEDGFGEDDFDDSEGPRRPTGLRTVQRSDSAFQQAAIANKLGRQLEQPVEVQGIWRDWMGKTRRVLTEKQTQVQSALPLTLIPIRIDLDILPYRPEAPLPTPPNARDFGIDENLPAYKIPELTPAYRLKDAFLWNLHEALLTPDQFAKTLVDELDLPLEKRGQMVLQITNQIRQQLEENAGAALHPLFVSSIQQQETQAPKSNVATTAVSRDQSSTPMPAVTNGESIGQEADGDAEAITVSATLPANDVHSPDDTYRCIISLNINLMNRLYTDKFEWSLLHPPGFAEMFSRQTCADLGLSPEWVPAMAHAIYEAVLRLKKEVCENGGLLNYVEIDNDAAEGVEAGWRYEPERLGADWEPTLEVLSPDEIEKREGDRERQIRRRRRETARFTTTTATPQTQNDFFADPETQDQPMGRGERSKKKRRFRSLSPLGRETPDISGYGGGGTLSETERANWRCSHCCVWGSAVWSVRDGPMGPRTLCMNCGLLYERDKQLPIWSRALFWGDRPVTTR